MLKTFPKCALSKKRKHCGDFAHSPQPPLPQSVMSISLDFRENAPPVTDIFLGSIIIKFSILFTPHERCFQSKCAASEIMRVERSLRYFFSRSLSIRQKSCQPNCHHRPPRFLTHTLPRRETSFGSMSPAVCN